ncbi:MAG: peptidoglycan DD-metalloendopeptidase family protein [Pseudomonadota bacterium]
MKYNSSSNLDFSHYNKQIVNKKSMKYPRYKIIISFVLLLVSVGLLFISLSSASNKPEERALVPTLDVILYEDLKLPAIPIKSASDKQPLVSSLKHQQTKTLVKILTPEQPSTRLPVEYKHVEYKIKSGDSLAVIFKRHNLSKKLLHNIIYSSQHGKQLARIKPGQTITFAFKAKTLSNNKTNQNDKITSRTSDFISISLQKTKLEALTIIRDSKNSDQFISTIETKQFEKRQRFVNVVINDSLFLSATKAGLSEGFTMELAHLFGWDIDFALDIRKGDSFSVLFNEHFLNGEKIENGQILVAEFVNQNKLYESIYFTDESGKSDYYSSDGYSKRKAFLRTPVAFSRISSRFSKSRKHPILKRTRAHKGVDYAAPRGTPIKSSGDGKVSFIGRKGGYGKVIQIQHGSKYKTVYGHMSSFNKKIKRGSRVKQGQVIGYVGSTGVATGPHLHYEFRVNGVHRNPLTVTLPKANPINKKYRVSFLQYSENMLSSLKLKKHDQLALFQE